MIWSKILFLVLICAFGYGPYKYIQKYGDLMNISLRNALIVSIVMSVSIIFLLSEIAQSAITFNGMLLSTVGALFLFWFAIPHIFPRIGEYPNHHILPPNGIILASLKLPLFIVKFVEIILQEVMFLYVIFVVMAELSFYERIFAFTGALVFMHLINIFFTTNKKLAYFVVFLSIPMGILFGTLIFKGYFLITLALHLSFYLAFTSYAWFGKRLAWRRRDFVQ